MRDFEVKNAKIFWGGLSPDPTQRPHPGPRPHPIMRRGTPPPQTPPLNVGKVPTFCHSSPHQRFLDPSLLVIIIIICFQIFRYNIMSYLLNLIAPSSSSLHQFSNAKRQQYVIWAGASFQIFLGGPNFFKFFNATGLLKNWKKQHFICSNLTSFIVPFFLFLFFSLFSSFFFFLFFFFLEGWRGPPAPQMTPLPLRLSLSI